MTRVKCTVAQLDGDFWRIDFGDPGALFDLSPHIVRIAAGPACYAATNVKNGHSAEGSSPAAALDAYLASCGLTRHDPKEETAEERVRAFLAMHDDDTTLMDIGPGARSSLEAADLRAILAELDRVRETSEALRASLRASNAVAQHVQGERDGLAESLDEHTRQIERLRAQRPVDVEAALAPVRDALCLISDHRASVKRSLDTAYKNGCGAQGSDYRLLGYAYDLAAVHVTDALAEAEKIGRGQ